MELNIAIHKVIFFHVFFYFFSFLHDSDSESFISKTKITRKTPVAGNTKDVEIAVPLKYLSNI